ncbi:hypothetical protein [Streptomyces sp. SudanB66_2053]|uniref:hypothetical protein n=1 Tax=Streptomyces sp. SudanB66_2053 TaxID=3035277 RepID=UPI003F567B31
MTASQSADGFYPVQTSQGLLWLRLAFPARPLGIAAALIVAIAARRVEERPLRDLADSEERERSA